MVIKRGMVKGDPAPPSIMVVFGASGDLTKRKLIPSLYNLARDHLLSENFAIVGFSRSKWSSEDFRKLLYKDVVETCEDCDREIWKKVIDRCHYVVGDVGDPKSYQDLAKALSEIDKTYQTQGNFLFYLATPPSLFFPIAKSLADAGLLKEPKDSWRRLIVEKPFGHDLESAKELNLNLKSVMGENQIYRMDHYLGKETVQNIMILRFANGIFEPIWNRQFIDSVQITVAETLGVETRGSYYEKAGALRDMVPSHLFQLLAMIAMEAPNSFAAEDVRDEKVKLLKAIKTLSPEDVIRQTVRGQYEYYREEQGVSPKSNTETYAALRLEVDNWRWAKVPFYLRTGKRLKNSVTEISIQFKSAPFRLFRQTEITQLSSNYLILQIKPEEKITLKIDAKIPGAMIRVGDVNMNFNYADAFGNWPSTGYETLLYDCMSGDPTLFQRADQVETAWSVIQPVIDLWSALSPRDFPNYAIGSAGPVAADELLLRDGRKWRDLKDTGESVPATQNVRTLRAAK